MSLGLALRLRAAGLAWTPRNGDRFLIPQPDLTDAVFVLSDLTVEVHEFPTGRVFGFNGTTEWALDSVQQRATVWLPREDQLRGLLGDAFARLERVGGRHRVVLVGETSFEDADAEEAYGLAVLHQLSRRN